MSNTSASLKSLIQSEYSAIVINDEEWSWDSANNEYRCKIFKNTELVIAPHWKFLAGKCVSQPIVFVENNTFNRAMGICKIDSFLKAWHYRFQLYYDREIFPGYVNVFEKKHSDRPAYFSKEEIPELALKTFLLGKNIFKTELNFASEESFMNSLIEVSEEKLYDMKYSMHMRTITVEAQAILRLLFFADKKYVETALEKYKSHGGYHRELIPMILPHMDEIIEMSPYQNVIT